ncbi:MAG: hypothetical protein ACI8QD_000518 [Cyclobacteriaceae bacterium]|jgi:hypothetical protein
MRKALILLLSITLLSLDAISQVKLGLKFSPSIVSSRTFLPADTLDVEPETGLFRISLGLIADYELSDTYFVSTGLLVVPKRIGINISPENGGSYPASQEFYDLQYIQIPATLKLYTNEIIPDGSIYFQVGAAADFKVFDQPVEEEYQFIQEFKPIDVSVILGGGFEYQAGLNTVIFTGITYNRGLANVVKTTQPTLSEEFSIRNSVLMFDIGLKF